MIMYIFIIDYFLLLLLINTRNLFTNAFHFIDYYQDSLALNVLLCRKAIYSRPLSSVGKLKQCKHTI